MLLLEVLSSVCFALATTLKYYKLAVNLIEKISFNIGYITVEPRYTYYLLYNYKATL
jgi:hypothetical protein